MLFRSLIEIAFIGYLAYRNSSRAKMKGLNSTLWGAVTILAYGTAMLMGCLVVCIACAQNIDMSMMSSTDPAVQAAARQQLQEMLNGNWLHLFTIEFFALGGYLFIRYILDKKPNKKQPEIHWMDKLGENR